MYIITNRVLHEEQKGLKVFGDEPNPRGPNELRLVKVTGVKQFTTQVLQDQLAPKEVVALAEQFNLPIDVNKPWYASLKVACEIMDQARKGGKHILLLVHGYNNDMRDVITMARELEELYKLIVVPFSWPANGGGQASGTLSYLSDKSDARVSATALSRCIGMVHNYHRLLTHGVRKDLMEKASSKYPNNREKSNEYFSQLVQQKCKVTVNMLCHSMGNYVAKYASQPSDSSLGQLVFDNIAMVAADANNPGHERWLGKFRVRNRLYVVINEDDLALKFSRIKPGSEQEERLGHYTRNLVSPNANYVDVTGAEGVGSDHSYFKGQPVAKNRDLKQLFKSMFEGGRAEEGLVYHADRNLYRFR